MNKEQIKAVNKTCRTSGAIGKNAIVPKLVKELANKDQELLDYGAGKHFIHTKALREQGLKVFPYDIGDNQTEEHLTTLKNREFDLVYASNVLNVLPDVKTVRETLKEMMDVTRPEVL